MVRMVAAIRPPMMASAIGPQKGEPASGISARTAADAVSTIGLKRRTAEPMMASRARCRPRYPA